MTQTSSLRMRLAIGVMALIISASPAAAGNIIKLMAGDMGQRRPDGCPSRWCACYLDLVLQKAGFQARNSWRARDFASYGKEAKPMSVGAIMVMPHHVGVVAGTCPDGRVQVISGNHAHRVGVGCYSPKRAIAWRAPVR